MKQVCSIKKVNGKWLIFDNTEPLDIPFDDGGEEGFTKEEAIQACINYNSVLESDSEEAAREAKALRSNTELAQILNQGINITENISISDLLIPKQEGIETLQLGLSV